MISRRWFLASAAAGFNPLPLEYIWINLQTQQKQRNWNDPDQAVNMGSLLKPFLTIAYGRTHRAFPVLVCRGSRDGCWLPAGHGRQDVVHALANSCNCYFHRIASDVNRPSLESLCLAYGLSPPESGVSGDELIGLEQGWLQSPRRTLEAFAALCRERTQRFVSVALTGMRLAALQGTAKAIGLPVFAKTGTAPCSHPLKAAGDGFVVAIFPTDQPRIAVLGRKHGTTGAQTARLIGPLLRSLL